MIRAFVILLFLSLGFESLFAVVDLAPQAKQAILIEASTGRVLFEKNADEKTAPSSMTKVATVMPAFRRLKLGTLHMTDRMTVSTNAWKQEGSRTFLTPNSTVSVEDLLKGIIIQSGNDAATTLAEGLGGSEENYAEEMNQLASAIGAHNTHFTNASGLPHENLYSTVRDLALIARRLIVDYPEFYPLFSEREFIYGGIRQGNRNPLLYKPHLRADGVKTGKTESGGHGMIGSATQNGMRLIVVVNGVKNVNERSAVAENLLLWGFREFKSKKLFKAGQIVSTAKVWLGKTATLPLVVPENVTLILSSTEIGKITSTVRFKNPVEAPIKAGDKVGTLIVKAGDKIIKTSPVVAGTTVEEVGMFGRAFSALKYIIWGSSQ